MKSIFVAGPRVIKKLDNKVLIKLKELIDNSFMIHVGDANGVDKLIQEFLNNLNYKNVKIFASNGKARNNLGNWSINTVNVDKSIKGFEFYAQKDKAMAEESNFGFMIWNGVSKGTLNNMINLRSENKYILLFLTTTKEFYEIKSDNDLLKIIGTCSDETKAIYRNLMSRNQLHRDKNDKVEQLAMVN